MRTCTTGRGDDCLRIHVRIIGRAGRLGPSSMSWSRVLLRRATTSPCLEVPPPPSCNCDDALKGLTSTKRQKQEYDRSYVEMKGPKYLRSAPLVALRAANVWRDDATSYSPGLLPPPFASPNRGTLRKKQCHVFSIKTVHPFCPPRIACLVWRALRFEWLRDPDARRTPQYLTPRDDL